MVQQLPTHPKWCVLNPAMATLFKLVSINLSQTIKRAVAFRTKPYVIGPRMRHRR